MCGVHNFAVKIMEVFLVVALLLLSCGSVVCNGDEATLAAALEVGQLHEFALQNENGTATFTYTLNRTAAGQVSKAIHKVC